jgi:hypothetical protein
MLSFIVNSRLQPSQDLRQRLSRHRDEKPVTATPLESALTKRDARNPFRFRSYENCRVVYPSFSNFPFQFNAVRKSRFRKSFVFCVLRTLSFSVSSNPCICHSYENHRGVAQLFPQWNSTGSFHQLRNRTPPTSHQPIVTSHLSGLTPSPSADTINSSPTEPGPARRSRGGFP